MSYSDYEGPYAVYDFTPDGIGELYVIPRCPECHKYITRGTVAVSVDGDRAKFEGFTCKKHGNVSPAGWFWL